MQTVISPDGTEIAFERSGSGPVLLIVGGALADHSFYAPLAAALSRRLTVYTYDRRGRGQSATPAPTPSSGSWRTWRR
jgi:pimeloyl-ACP methyl ester carboxylesterase